MSREFKLTGPFQNIHIKDAMVTSLFVLLLMTFAVGVVFGQHTSRVLYAKLQALNVERDRLNNEWSQLLLENATWTSDIRVEKVAREQLQMIIPTKIEMIKP